MILDQKQIQVIFLFKFKMGRKTAETTRNINNAFGLSTYSLVMVQEVQPIESHHRSRSS